MDFQKLLNYGEKQGCQLVEFYISKSKNLSLKLREGILENITESMGQGIGIRVIKDNRQSLVYATEISDESIKKAIDDGLTIAPYLDEEKELSFETNVVFEDVLEADKIKAIEDTELAEKINYLHEMEKTGKENSKYPVTIESASYEEAIYESCILNSQGLSKKETGAYCGSYVAMALANEGVQETGDSYCYTTDIKELFNRNIGKEAYSKGASMIGATGLKTGTYTAIFNTEATIDFLSLLGVSFNGENIYKGKSLFKDKWNQALISPLISIVDDGTLKGKMGTSYFDGEGVETRRTLLMDKGVFKEGLYNLTMAKLSGRSTTGNCARSYQSLPSIGVSNFYIENGETPKGDLLKEMHNGLIIKDLMGLHMADPITGDFSLGATGLIVKNGQVEKGFRGVTVSGNLMDLFSNVLKVGDDLTFKITKGAPSLLVKDVIISGS
ncbi:hypothetical protein AZF37_05610 [endosymbiont 'TC1' of Trimyema compressum]|uniref:TldD/PmbA family protein n=1 Tax=endosymbiont 'TC1' of Trimyema compressum TaxID=243899 RepID=UPI0007F1090D|nr:TldD/PmbA family protein [endosymbiont 'TC1' of Trimyema compressum]AMP20719.1 hypothetical protein AZF37_05610 [endosymbiont 'TC1' of Trimyema compressum]